MLVYTSVTRSYLPKARVLAQSLKNFHPEWTFLLLYSDELPPGFNIENEPFDEVLTIKDLGIPNWEGWAFGHTIVELCTAVKGVAAELLAERPSVSKLMYLDPDVKVFNSLEPLSNLLDNNDILLTPHLLHREKDEQAIKDNEISALKHGVFNLGFFGAKASGQGKEFIQWWADRLRSFCIDDIPGGLFTDQRWCDLAPGFFDKLHIVRDPGYNVATWNIAHRPITIQDNGTCYAADVPLRFYHFTGYDSGDGLGMLQRYAGKQGCAKTLWQEYGEDLAAMGHGQSLYRDWSLGYFSDGTKIPDQSRRAYRSRKDLQKAFVNPYLVEDGGFKGWWETEGHIQYRQGDLTAPNYERLCTVGRWLHRQVRRVVRP
jgi:hypothetical protein